MIRSMTGFGAGRAQVGSETIAVELRSVNGKFCEVRAHLPRELSGMEPVVSKMVKARLARGVVDVSVRRDAAAEQRGFSPRVDVPLAAACANLSQAPHSHSIVAVLASDGRSPAPISRAERPRRPLLRRAIHPRAIGDLTDFVVLGYR